MSEHKRYIVQFMSPAPYQQHYQIYDVDKKRVISTCNNYADALTVGASLNVAEGYKWEPILTRNEMGERS